MKRAKLSALQIATSVVAAVTAIACATLLLLGIWTGDDRWHLTAIIPGFVAFATIFGGPILWGCDDE